MFGTCVLQASNKKSYLKNSCGTMYIMNIPRITSTCNLIFFLYTHLPVGIMNSPVTGMILHGALHNQYKILY